MSDARAEARRSATGGPAPVRDARLRLLLVEDDAGDALLVEELLADADLDVELTWARTLDEAVERLDVDLVLLDLGLPDAVGIAARSSGCSRRVRRASSC